LMPGGYQTDEHRLPPGRGAALDTVTVPAGTYPIGSDTHEPFDNEHPRHTVELHEFAIDRFPVTCGQYLEFIKADGYMRRDLWSGKGWDWRLREDATAPAYWRRDGNRWLRDRFGRSVPVDANQPVMHVCWYEADAYCRWRGRRLPTEFEWEVAAAWDPAARASR